MQDALQHFDSEGGDHKFTQSGSSFQVHGFFSKSLGKRLHCVERHETCSVVEFILVRGELEIMVNSKCKRTLSNGQRNEKQDLLSTRDRSPYHECEARSRP